ncbi:MAG: gamma carbonic anhydrase family protein [gamma proteobacterium endosymbiont of Lamellibrachia anaximandri]|nr:gamma carbonic anhydrase family protein [gamma proteobacterium endosymbiont of Lamellibrachia anaximandri]MBL3616436.1 gamma carbonic anhydrase family protein [gamma proteobacterium endosymbiont of Lamellibrachia anaximandri]
MSNIRPFESSMPQVATDAWIDETAVVIGNVSIGSHSSVWPMTVIRGDVHAIRIGNESNVQDGCVLHVSHDSKYQPGGSPLILGDRVTVGHKAVLHGCNIADSCFIGMGCTILDGAVLESRAMLGAGSLVPSGKHLEGGYLWVGTPARRVRPLSDQELEYLDYSAAHYVRLMKRHTGKKW